MLIPGSSAWLDPGSSAWLDPGSSAWLNPDNSSRRTSARLAGGWLAVADSSDASGLHQKTDALKQWGTHVVARGR